MGAWTGFGYSAPFLFGGCMSLIAVIMMVTLMPKPAAGKLDSNI
jgi:predicted MFS family arabinose efflux permease